MRYLLSPLALTLLFVFPLLTGCGGTANSPNVADSAVDPGEAEFAVLVFSKTDGFRHNSIEAGIAAMEELGAENNFSVTATEDANYFTEDDLSGYGAVVFLNTTQNVFNDEQRSAFQNYIQNGGGFVGIHSAADTEYEWPWYGELVGGYFDGHPPVQEAVIEVIDPNHPSTNFLPDPWVHTDEWYSYRDMNEDVNVLLNLDEDSYDLGDTPAMGEEHPIAWYHEYDGGRAWYTGLGHTVEAYEDDLFLRHVLGGIRWVAGLATDQV